MPNAKRILLSLQPELLEKVDKKSKSENLSRSEWIREAITFYLEEGARLQIRKQMESGYARMGMINLKLAEEGTEQALEDFTSYENKLNVGE